MEIGPTCPSSTGWPAASTLDLQAVIHIRGGHLLPTAPRHRRDAAAQHRGRPHQPPLQRPAGQCDQGGSGATGRGVDPGPAGLAVQLSVRHPIAEGLEVTEPHPPAAAIFYSEGVLVEKQPLPLCEDGQRGDRLLAEVSSHERDGLGPDGGLAEPLPDQRAERFALRRCQRAELLPHQQPHLPGGERRAAQDNTMLAPLLGTAAGRGLLSQIIDRRILAEKGLLLPGLPRHREPSKLLTPACWPSRSSCRSAQLDETAARASLAALGYTENAMDGFYTADGPEG